MNGMFGLPRQPEPTAIARSLVWQIFSQDMPDMSTARYVARYLFSLADIYICLLPNMQNVLPDIPLSAAKIHTVAVMNVPLLPVRLQLNSVYGNTLPLFQFSVFHYVLICGTFSTGLVFAFSL